MMQQFKGFWSTQGRIDRKTFWLYFAVLVALSVLSSLLPEHLKVLDSGITIACFIPTICTYAKRLHDLGRTGWWQLAPMPLLLVGLLFIRHAHTALLVGAGAAMLAQLGLILWLGLAPGQTTSNRFGPPPGAPLTDPEVFA